MDRFVFGTDTQFKGLKTALEDGLLHVYNCRLPECFSKSECRIGFEKCTSDHSSYKILIDFGIRSSREASPLLSIWLKEGELTFLDFNDLKEFLQGLYTLYLGRR